MSPLAIKESRSRMKPTECLDLNLKILKMWPVCPLDEVSSLAWINILHKCYTAFTVILFFSMSVPGPLFYVFEEYTLEDAIEMMSILLTQLRSGMKMMTFIIYKKEIQKLINALYENFYIHGRNLTTEESSIIREAIKHTRKITIGYFVLICLLIWSMILHPITFKSTDQAQLDDTNHTATLPRLPFKTWYPKWDPTKSPQFEIEYAAQAILTVLEASSVGSIDPFCATLMVYVACQFELLSISLKNINKNAFLKSGPAIHGKREEGCSPKRVLTLDNISLLPVRPEHTGSNIERNVSGSGCMNESGLNNLQGINILLQSDEGNQIPSATESYGQTERETIIYIKKCIKHHQSLLT
jgi:hypothetical protein